MDKFELIKRNTQEVVDEKELKDIIKKTKKSAYVGFAPTGKLHIGYLIPLTKVKDFVDAGFEFTFLIADLHAFLDDKKTPWEQLNLRSEYYEKTIKSIFKSMKVDLKKIKFVKGSDFQLSKEYALDLYHLAGEITLNRSKRSASEVVRFKEDPKLGGFIYPIMQLLDPCYLNADVSFGGIDQRGIYMMGREVLPKYKKRTITCVFTPLLPGLTGSKMSASDEKSKIDILDSEKELNDKLKNAFCPVGVVEGNGVLAFIENVIFPLNGTFKIARDKKFGGDLTYDNHKELEKDYKDKKVHPLDLKNSLALELNKLLEPVRKEMSKHKSLIEKAY